MLNEAIFGNVALAAIAPRTFERIVARGNHNVFSMDECEEGFDFIHDLYASFQYSGLNSRFLLN